MSLSIIIAWDLYDKKGRIISDGKHFTSLDGVLVSRNVKLGTDRIFTVMWESGCEMYENPLWGEYYPFIPFISEIMFGFTSGGRVTFHIRMLTRLDLLPSVLETSKETAFLSMRDISSNIPLFLSRNPGWEIQSIVTDPIQNTSFWNWDAREKGIHF